jgi:DNA-directed RNA polymerase subunit M/transcription elongation factor TFIIS
MAEAFNMAWGVVKAQTECPTCGANTHANDLVPFPSDVSDTATGFFACEVCGMRWSEEVSPTG